LKLPVICPMNEKTIKSLSIPPNKNVYLLGGGLVFLVIWVAIYGPRTQELQRLKIHFRDMQNQIQDTEKTVAKGESLNEGVQRLKELASVLESKFPTKEEEGLRLISDLARSHHLEIGSLKVQPKEILLDSQNNEVKILGKSAHKVLVSMDMKGKYEDLVKYVEGLKKTIVGYFTIERLKINKETVEATILNISLELYLYLLI